MLSSLQHRLSNSSTTSNATTDSTSSQSGKKKITCFITEADNKVHNLALHEKATGMDCLKAFCQQLGLEEIEYFGLQYLGQSNEILWLNLRNRVRKQLSAHGPYNLYFRVKFFVPVDHLLLHECREQYYYNVMKHLQSGFWDQGCTQTITDGELLAIMAMVAFGKFQEPTSFSQYACLWPEVCHPIPHEVLRDAARHHRYLSELAPSKAVLQHLFLDKVSQRSPLYGTFFYEAKNSSEKPILVGINPSGLMECHAITRKILECWTYAAIESVELGDKIVTVTTKDDEGMVGSRIYRCITRTVSVSLHRYLTEARCFYYCETVAQDVYQRTMEDHKRRLSHKSFTSCRDYAFDVQSTARQVFERDRSLSTHGRCSLADQMPVTDVLENNEAGIITMEDAIQPRQVKSPSVSTTQSSCTSDTGLTFSRNNSRSEMLQKLKEELRTKLASTLCRVCHRQQIVCVFLPCGHALCCKPCAQQFQNCFLCQNPVKEARIFFQTWPEDIAFDVINAASSSAPY